MHKPARDRLQLVELSLLKPAALSLPMTYAVGLAALGTLPSPRYLLVCWTSSGAP